MSAITASLTSLPFAQFKRHSTFYLWYDGIYALLALGGIFVLVRSGWEGVAPEFSPWLLLGLPGALYVMIMAHVFSHNASHGSFPKAVNRVVGELSAALVLTKFASWEIVHRRHHRYSDDPEKDPHPATRGYWRYAFATLINVELQLRQSYYDIYGDTPQTRRYEKFRAALSFGSGVMLGAFFFVVLGPGAFFMLYLPAFIGAALFVIHFNWSGHNAHRDEGPIEPTDLDYGWYWLGNRIFFGIYYHGTHHKLAMVFNPMKAAKKRERREQVRAAA